MKEVIVEFIEDGTDRVIRTCPLEEYKSDIESINNTIPKEYKFLKKNVMKQITLQEVLYEMTFRFDLKTSVENILMDNLSDETYGMLYRRLSILFADGNLMKSIDVVMDVVEEIYEGFYDEDREKIVEVILTHYPDLHSDTIVLTLN